MPKDQLTDQYLVLSCSACPDLHCFVLQNLKVENEEIDEQRSLSNVAGNIDEDGVGVDDIASGITEGMKEESAHGDVTELPVFCFSLTTAGR